MYVDLRMVEQYRTAVLDLARDLFIAWRHFDLARVLARVLASTAVLNTSSNCPGIY